MHTHFDNGLLKVLRRPASRTLQITGKGRLRLPADGDFKGDLNVNWASDDLTCEVRFQSGSQTRPDLEHEPSEIGEIIPSEEYGEGAGITEEGILFELRRCIGVGSHWAEATSSVRCKAGSIKLTHSDVEPPYYEAYTIYGLSMSLWPNVTLVRDHSGCEHCVRDALDTVLDGEPVRLQSLGEHFCRLVFRRPSPLPFERRELVEEVFPLLSFILGARLSVVREEAFSQSGEIVQETYLHTTRSYDSATYMSPIFTSAGSEVFFDLGRVISAAYERYKCWKAKIFLDEAIFHKMSAERLASESKFALLGISFETLSSSYARYLQGETSLTGASTYLSQKAFRKATLPIAKELEKALSPLTGSVSSMMGKFYAINNRAMQNRFESLFDYLGIVPNDKEREALKKRNSAIHEGVLDRNRSNIQLQRVVDLEATMMVLINKMILNLLEYRGCIVDYSTKGYPEVPIERANKPG